MAKTEAIARLRHTTYVGEVSLSGSCTYYGSHILQHPVTTILRTAVMRIKALTCEGSFQGG